MITEVQPSPDSAATGTVERMPAWQCIGCGRIEGLQTCIGVCQDAKVQFVYASDYDAALAKLTLATQQADQLRAVLRHLAWTTPRAGEWERSYRALQAEARRALGTGADAGKDSGR